MARYGLPDWNKGDLISAAKLRKMVEHMVRITIQQPQPGAGGLEVVQDAAGTRLRVIVPPTGWALCQLGSSLGPATGTWPSLTPTTQTGVNLYQPLGGSLVKIASSQKIYNWRNVTWAASKTTLVLVAGDGTWAVEDQDC